MNARAMKILVLDNYDSFTYNLVHIIRELGHAVEVFRNDEIDLDAVAAYDKILLSPGPGVPSEAGIMPRLLTRYLSQKHILGVCLGHQGIGECLGAQLYNMPDVLHGVGTGVQVLDGDDPLFRGVPERFTIGRYHSWAVDRQTLNDSIRVLAVDETGEIMALRHVEYPVFGVQFHPESVITDHGKRIIQNWLDLPVNQAPIEQPSSPQAMKDILNRLFAYERLTRAEAREVLTHIARGGVYNAAQVAAFLTVYIMRGISVEELSGFRDAMLELCVPVDLAAYDPIDLCGTGGDGQDTFNISTLATFVVAGAGVPVAKHGNYGVSSVSGSSNIIEYFGGTFTSEADKLRQQMETCGLCFLHAPLFHPAMKNVGPIRRDLGVKTFFNMLGPMVNPALPRKQLVGVFSMELARLYGYLYQQSGRRFTILHAVDGYDEVSLTGPVKVLSNDGERLLYPADLGLDPVRPEDLRGGRTVEEAGRIFERVLRNEGTPAQQAVVLANAALAIQTARAGATLADSLATARESLESGQALAVFQRFIGL
ncbi:MAG: hypothetical protein OHK0039_23360 [Bacteroidia bacterium]